jgi:hypothetical protein
MNVAPALEGLLYLLDLNGSALALWRVDGAPASSDYHRASFWNTPRDLRPNGPRRVAAKELETHEP